MSSLYEIILFTASNKYYADPIINYLDPNNTIFHHRLYRGSCLRFNDIFVKDLRILSNIDLKDVAIIDNHIYSFAF